MALALGADGPLERLPRDSDRRGAPLPGEGPVVAARVDEGPRRRLTIRASPVAGRHLPRGADPVRHDRAV